jgi:hypothetical protein
MLVGRQTECAAVDLSNLPETSLEVTLGLVLYTAILDEAREVVQAVVTVDPTKVVDVAVETERARGLQFEAEKLLDLSLEVVQAHAVDGVLQTGIFTTNNE